MGIADGAKNDPEILDELKVTDSTKASQSQSAENNNANTRAAGKENNSAEQY